MKWAKDRLRKYKALGWYITKYEQYKPIRFFTWGALVFLTHQTLAAIFIASGQSRTLSQIIGYLFALSLEFTLHKFLTFRNKEKRNSAQFKNFALIRLTMLALFSVSIILMQKHGLATWFYPIYCLIIAFIVFLQGCTNFLFDSFITFRQGYIKFSFETVLTLLRKEKVTNQKRR